MPSSNCGYATGLAGLIADLGLSAEHYLEYLAGEAGRPINAVRKRQRRTTYSAYPSSCSRANRSGVTTVALLEQRLGEAGLAIGDKATAA